jgi:hypothetical protein
LVLCAIPAGPRFYDAISGQLTAVNHSFAYGSTIDGNRAAAIRGKFDTGTNNTFPSPTGMDEITGDYSIFAEARPEINGSFPQIIFSFENSNGYGFGLQFDDSNLQYNSLLIQHAYEDRNGSSTECLGTNYEQYTHRFAVTRSGTTVKRYTKGVLAETGTYSTAITANSNRRTNILSRGGYTTAGASASVILVWNRVISESEFKSLYWNPWVVFESLVMGGMQAGTSYTHPTLSNARMGSLTSTGGVPLVDYAF